MRAPFFLRGGAWLSRMFGDRAGYYRQRDAVRGVQIYGESAAQPECRPAPARLQVKRAQWV